MVRKFLEDIFRRKLDVLHSARVVHTLYQQQKQGKYCDLKVVVEDQQYFVHRCVLASASAQLDAQINGLDTIQLVGVTNYGFERLLEILYSGKMSKVAMVDSTRFHQIISAADALNAESVIEYCARERSDLMKLVIDQAGSATKTTSENSSGATTNISEMSVAESMAVDSPATDLETVPFASDNTSNEPSPAEASDPIVPDVFANPSRPIKTEPNIPEHIEENHESLNWDVNVKEEPKDTTDRSEMGERVAAEVEVAEASAINEPAVNPMQKLSMTKQPDPSLIQSTEAGLLPPSDDMVSPARTPLIDSIAGNIEKKLTEEEPTVSHVVGERLQSGGTSMLSGALSMLQGVKCSVCKRMFSTTHHLKVHMKKHTGGTKPFRCDTCGMRFSFQMTLINHVKLHEPKKYWCRVCGRDFKLNRNLLAHIQHVHPEEVEFAATESPYSFPKSFVGPSLEGSSRRKTPPVKRPIGAQNVEGSEEDLFPPEEQPVAHASNFEPDMKAGTELDTLKKAVENVQVGGDGKYSCPMCEKGFSRRWNLKCHVLTHAENHHPRRQSLKMKLPEKKAPKMRMNLPFVCPECGKSFGSLGNLRKHSTVVHPYSEAVEAIYCPSMVPYVKQQPRKPGQMNMSQSPISEQISCWCDICGRGFRRLRNLRNHMETHTGMGYECHICGRTFAQKDGLNGHLWVHGGLGGPKTIPGSEQGQESWDQIPVNTEQIP